jgi:hypothetical protein
MPPLLPRAVQFSLVILRGEIITYESHAGEKGKKIRRLALFFFSLFAADQRSDGAFAVKFLICKIFDVTDY